MKKITAILLAAVALTSAQSLYGVRYPGGLESGKSGFASRMGGSGIGANENYLMMTHNPGNLGNISHSVYSLKLSLDYTRTTSGDDQSDQVAMSPDLIGFAFPLGKAGTFGFSFSRLNGNRYRYRSGQTVLATDATTGDSITGWTGLDRQSGTTAFEAGWGYKLFPFFRPGISYQRYYLTVQDNRITKTDNFGGTGDSTRITQAGNTIRGGFSGSMGKFTYGITGEYSFMDDVKFKRTVNEISLYQSYLGSSYVSSLIHDSASIDTSYQLHLPPSGGIGIGYQINEKMLATADFSMRLWEQAYTDAPTAVFYDKYVNTQSGSAGFQFIPAPNLLAPRYFEQIRYSGGVRYTTLPVEGDWEMGISAGLGLPLGAAGMLDLGFEGGVRRSDKLSSTEENFFKFTLTTSGGKQWKRSSGNVY